MKEQCRNCKWMEGDYGWRPTEEYHDGTCHRRAPIGIKNNEMGTPNVALWPHVRGRDGCGDFEKFNAVPSPRSWWKLTIPELMARWGL